MAEMNNLANMNADSLRVYTRYVKSLIAENTGGGGGVSDYSSLTNLPTINNVTIDGDKTAAELGLAKTTDIPKKVSDLVNDNNYLTSADLPETVSKTSQLENDSEFITLDDVPSIPTKISELENDSKFITAGAIPSSISSFENDKGYITADDIPSNISGFTNDVGYITSAALPTDVSELTNNVGYITSEELPKDISELNNDVGYITTENLPKDISELNNDTGYITSSSLPKNVSELTNDTGYITSAALPTQTSDLINNSGFITQAALPTKVSELTNDSNFLTEIEVDGESIDFNDNGELETIGLTEEDIKAIFEEEFPIINYPDTYVQRTTKIGSHTLNSDITISDLKSDLEIDKKITAPSTGEIGQVLAVKTVSSNGTPTSWEAITYKPAEGSGDKTYILPTATATIKGGVTIGDNISLDGSRISISADNIKSALGFTPLSDAGVTTVETSTTNGNIKINGAETVVYLHPGSGTNPHGTTKSDLGLGNVGNFKAVSTVANQGLSTTEKSNARDNIGAGTSNFSGSYNDLTNKPTIPNYSSATTSAAGLMSAADKEKLDGITMNANNYVHPGSGTNPHGTTKSDIGLGNVGNFKAVSTVASQGLTSTEKANARNNIGAGTSSFSGSYNDLSNKPTIPSYSNASTSTAGLMSATDKAKLDGIDENANKYIHPIRDNPALLGLHKVQVDSFGHVIDTTPVTKSDITNLGIPGSDTNTWRGIQNNLTSTSTSDSLSAYQGKVLNDKFGNYLPLSGGQMTGNLNLTESKNIVLRPGLSSYTGGIGWDTQGNECLALWAKNSVTRLRWNAGVDMTTLNQGAMMQITPDFEVTKDSGTAKLFVAGMQVPVFKKINSNTGSCDGTHSITITDDFNNFDIVIINYDYIDSFSVLFKSTIVPGRNKSILVDALPLSPESISTNSGEIYTIGFYYDPSTKKLTCRGAGSYVEVLSVIGVKFP